jgi:hypothetical protein
MNIAAITESRKKLKGIMETNNCIVIYSGVNRRTQTQAGDKIGIHKSKIFLLTRNTGVTEELR